jgi:hypothetical protein
MRRMAGLKKYECVKFGFFANDFRLNGHYFVRRANRLYFIGMRTSTCQARLTEFVFVKIATKIDEKSRKAKCILLYCELWLTSESTQSETEAVGPVPDLIGC